MIFSFYYRNLLCNDILSLPTKGAFNLHGSLLPKYRGRAPLNWVLVNGEKETGVTLHRMTQRADAGDIVAQQSVAISDTDVALSLHQKLCAASQSLLSDVLPKIRSGQTQERAQDEAQATYVGRRTPEDGRLTWEKPAQELHNLVRAVISSKPVVAIKRRTRVLILGVNGFIGNHLTERLLQDDNYEIYGLDIGSDAISRFLDSPRFHFVEGDISIHSEWIEYHIKKCDVVLPLVAIATPIEYTRNPLRVFELDFEENLKIIRDCVKYNKRIIFPSTSEVYGMCTDANFDEDTSNLVVGPINKQRWIYSVSKQLLDRVIWAYGDKTGLKFTLFRPFNWMGPRLDNLNAARIGSSRAITQLILNLVEGSPIKLIEGGKQKRCFTDISDGIEALFRIIENKDGRCDGQIINIGNPDNEASIKELAEMLLDCFERTPQTEHSQRQTLPGLAADGRNAPDGRRDAGLLFTHR